MAKKAKKSTRKQPFYLEMAGKIAKDMNRRGSRVPIWDDRVDEKVKKELHEGLLIARGRFDAVDTDCLIRAAVKLFNAAPWRMQEAAVSAVSIYDTPIGLSGLSDRIKQALKIAEVFME